jgi:hypothetical protein
MRPAQILLSLLFVAFTCAWPWPPRLHDIGGFLERRADASQGGELSSVPAVFLLLTERPRIRVVRGPLDSIGRLTIEFRIRGGNDRRSGNQHRNRHRLRLGQTDRSGDGGWIGQPREQNEPSGPDDDHRPAPAPRGHRDAHAGRHGLHDVL